MFLNVKFVKMLKKLVQIFNYKIIMKYKILNLIKIKYRSEKYKNNI
jgi:hypothetical protein